MKQITRQFNKKNTASGFRKAQKPIPIRIYELSLKSVIKYTLF